MRCKGRRDALRSLTSSGAAKDTLRTEVDAKPRSRRACATARDHSPRTVPLSPPKTRLNAGAQPTSPPPRGRGRKSLVLTPRRPAPQAGEPSKAARGPPRQSGRAPEIQEIGRAGPSAQRLLQL